MGLAAGVLVTSLSALTDFGPTPIDGPQPHAQFLPAAAANAHGLMVVYRAFPANDASGKRWWTYRARSAGFDGHFGPEVDLLEPLSGPLMKLGRLASPQQLVGCGEGFVLAWLEGSHVIIRVLDSSPGVRRRLEL